VSVYLAHLDAASGAVVADPLLIFQGLQLDPYSVQEQRDRTGGTVTITTQWRGQLALGKVRGIKSNLVSHQQVEPGDTFFLNTATLGSLPVYWGTPIPAQSSSAGGGGGGRGGSDGGSSGGGTQRS